MPVKKKKVIEEEDDDGAPFAPIPNEPAKTPALTRDKVIPPVVKQAEVIPPAKENPYYTKTLWHGIKEVFQCNTCGVFRDGTQEDAMIVHVVIHVPRLEQDALRDKLMKEYKND